MNHEHVHNILIALTFLAIGLGFGFFFGSYWERWNWNELIKIGAIPTPKTRRSGVHRNLTKNS